MRSGDDKTNFSKDGGRSGYVYCMIAAAWKIAPPPQSFKGVSSSNHHAPGAYAAYSNDASGAGSSDYHTNQTISASTLLPKLKHMQAVSQGVSEWPPCCAAQSKREDMEGKSRSGIECENSERFPRSCTCNKNDGINLILKKASSSPVVRNENHSLRLSRRATPQPGI